MSDANKVERHHSFRNQRPQKSFDYKGFKVCIAESGPHFEYGGEITKKEFPHGYYEALYTILINEKALFEMPLIFDFMHDYHLTDEARKQARIKAAEKTAMVHLDDFMQVSHEKSH